MLEPLDDRVLIRPDDMPDTTKGGMIIPNSAKEKPTRGTIIAVGPGRYELGTWIGQLLQVGDRVVYGKYSGVPLQDGDDEVVLIRAMDVLAKEVPKVEFTGPQIVKESAAGAAADTGAAP
jgi:chaperonin GroES